MKISVVTPVRNGAAFIAQTIESVIHQRGSFEIEYVVVDGASSDGTVELVRQYSGALDDGTIKVNCKGVSLTLVSEPDQGMYDALNKGFGLCSGDIYCYINADDIYLPEAFQLVSRVFDSFEGIDWLKGITNYIDEDGLPTGTGRCFCYHRDWIEQGVYGREAYFIQQDSVFWRRSLHNAAGSIPASLKLAGDLYLWMTFARLARLVSVSVPVSCFRRRSDQLSAGGRRYAEEADLLIARPRSLPRRVLLAALLRLPMYVSTRIYRVLFPAHRLSVVTVSASGLTLCEDADFVGRSQDPGNHLRWPSEGTHVE